MNLGDKEYSQTQFLNMNIMVTNQKSKEMPPEKFQGQFLVGQGMASFCNKKLQELCTCNIV